MSDEKMRTEETILEIPLTLGVVGAVLLPSLVAARDIVATS